MSKYIYCIEDQTGRVKVGHSKNPIRRWAEICEPAGLEVVNAIYMKSDLPLDLEQAFKLYFDDNRMRGEWFNIKFVDAASFLLTPGSKI